MRFYLLSLTCLLVSGCARDPEPAAPEPRVTAPPAAPAEASDARARIAAFGDSLSEGFGAPPGQSYPDFLQKELDRAGYRYKVVNLGISGDTTTGGLNRLGAVIDLKPDIVILELGGNDGLRGVPIASTRENLDEMTGRLTGRGIRVVMAGMSLPPNYGARYIQEFERTYRDLAVKHKATLIPFLLSGIVEKLRTRPGLMQRDGIHPTAEGNAVVAKTVMRAIEPLLVK